MKYTQDQPNTIKIEMTEGCNLRCWFCGMNSIRGREDNFKFLRIDNAETIAHAIKHAGFNSRIEFTGRGEPTANPNHIRIIEKVRTYLPKASIMLSSNGGFIARSLDPVAHLERMFAAGVNTVVIERYEGQKFAHTIESACDTALTLGFKTYRYPENADAKPNDRVHHNTRRVIFLQDIAKAENGTHASLNNQCGTAAKPDASQAGKRCAKPFRELVIRHDMRVPLCCNDWNGRIHIGTVADAGSLTAIWQCETLMAARRFLYAGERTFVPCDGCNDRSYRPGILPDKQGVKDMEPPTMHDFSILEEKAANPPLTPNIRTRPWMKETK